MTTGSEIFLVYGTAGGFAGLLSGLLGVGGAVITVPALIFVFTSQHFPAETIYLMAVGTTFANIFCNSVASVITHHRRGGVAWPVMLRMTPGILAGTLVGSSVAAHAPHRFLETFFVIFLFWMGVRMLRQPAQRPIKPFPGRIGLASAGFGIGGLCSLTGAGGGSLTVPYLARGGLDFRQAVGTGSALGLPIAVAGVVGYFLNGLRVSGLPAHSLGFIYLPALAMLFFAGILFAPLGANLAHRLPVARLRRIFALLLCLLAARMGYGLLMG